jgi:hypothetical protein
MFEILNIKRVQQSTTTGNLKYDLELLFFLTGIWNIFLKLYLVTYFFIFITLLSPSFLIHFKKTTFHVQ